MIEISIIMPIYNSEKTLKNTLESILNQSFKMNYEIILVNDGSTDSTENICNEYMSLYKNIRYIKIENKGVSNARNTGLKLASGKYLMFVDSDDTLDYEALDKMYEQIKLGDVDLVIAGYNRINEKTKKIVEIHAEEKKYEKNEFDKVIIYGQSENLFNQLWNKIYKLDIIKEKKIRFDINLSLGEDFKFIMEYLTHINKIKMCDYLIYNYINTISGLNIKYRKNRLDINIENMKLLEDYFVTNNYNSSYINKKYFITILSGLSNICKNPNKNDRNLELKKFINNEFIYEKISKKISFKYTFIKLILLTRNIYILLFLGKILNFYSFIYKKFKLGY